MKTKDEMRLQNLVRRCIICLSHVNNATNKIVPPVMKSYYSSLSEYNQDLNAMLAFDQNKVKLGSKSAKATRILIKYLREELCSMIPQNVWIRVGNFALTYNANRILIKLACLLDENGKEIKFESIPFAEFTLYPAFSGPYTWYIGITMVYAVMHRKLSDEDIQELNESINNDPHIKFVPILGGFYTVEESVLLYAPMDMQGRILLNEKNEPAWSVVEEFPSEHFCYLFPLIENLTGGLDNIQHIELY